MAETTRTVYRELYGTNSELSTVEGASPFGDAWVHKA